MKFVFLKQVQIIKQLPMQYWHCFDQERDLNTKVEYWFQFTPKEFLFSQSICGDFELFFFFLSQKFKNNTIFDENQPAHALLDENLPVTLKCPQRRQPVKLISLLRCLCCHANKQKLEKRFFFLFEENPNESSFPQFGFTGVTVCAFGVLQFAYIHSPSP